jgi:hypothetical protein
MAMGSQENGENGERNEEVPELQTLIQNEFQKQSQLLGCEHAK